MQDDEPDFLSKVLSGCPQNKLAEAIAEWERLEVDAARARHKVAINQPHKDRTHAQP